MSSSPEHPHYYDAILRIWLFGGIGGPVLLFVFFWENPIPEGLPELWNAIRISGAGVVAGLAFSWPFFMLLVGLAALLDRLRAKPYYVFTVLSASTFCTAAPIAVLNACFLPVGTGFWLSYMIAVWIGIFWTYRQRPPK